MKARWFVFPFLLGGCAEGDPAPSETGPVCTEPTAVQCRDASLLSLDMTAEEVTAGAIESTDEGDHFHTHVDATAGGFPATGGFVYGKFTENGLEKVELTDDASFDSMDWDISFRRFVIRLNSGFGGPSCVTAARTAPETDFKTLSSLDESLELRAEEYLTPDTCDLVPDGSGLGTSPGVVLQAYWNYVGCLQMTGNVYVLQLADGRHVKLVVTQFYEEEAQRQCDEEASLPSVTGSGNIQFDWAFLD